MAGELLFLVKMGVIALRLFIVALVVLWLSGCTDRLESPARTMPSQAVGGSSAIAGTPKAKDAPKEKGTPSNAPFPSANASHDNNEDIVRTITDIKKWQHPVKKILDTAGRLEKVEFKDNETYPIFYVDFIQTPNYTFYTELAEANGYWNFSVVNTDRGGKEVVDVVCDASKKRVIHISGYEEYKLADPVVKLTEDDFSLYTEGKFQPFDLNWTSYADIALVSSVSQYKGESYWSYHYGNLSAAVTAGRFGEVMSIGIERTIRGIIKGDSAEKVKQLYGEPNEIVQNLAFAANRTLVYNDDGDKQLLFDLEADQIQWIQINIASYYNILYR
ncbi:MAG: hypothetical protein J7639_30305 [Paenibacillaceae bacterium]|nr:hypothetical protein [Paenibacillaceae bacterium]